MGDKESAKGEEEAEGEGEVNVREWDAWEGVRTERESKERDTLIEGAITWLPRNLALEKFSGIHKDDPAKTLSSWEEGALTDWWLS